MSHAQQRYEEGRAYAARQEWTRARRCFRDASEAGHGDATTELALFLLFGIGVPTDYAAATEMLLKAEQQGAGEAAYQLALMSWVDSYVKYDLAKAAERLRFAASTEFPPALRAIALVYRRMSASGGDALDRLADRCLARAAHYRDAISAKLLGLRADAGIAVPEGDGASIPALSELPLPDLVPRRLGRPERLYDSPFVETIDDVYSREECEYIIALGAPNLQRSMTIHDAGDRLLETEHRRSSDHSFVTFQEDLALRWLQARMLAHVEVPLRNAEPLVLLRYVPGEEYRPHRDYLPPSAPGNSKHPDQPGQRVHTVFSYLADVEGGGETDFPGLGVRITPKTGRVVHFVNLRPDGTPDERTWHAGLPVTAGTKWLATLWTRERAIRAY